MSSLVPIGPRPESQLKINMNNYEVDQFGLALARTTLHCCPPDSSKYAHHLKSLYVKLNKAYKSSHTLQYLEESVEILNEMAIIYPSSHPEHPNMCFDLARTLRDYYIHTGDESKLFQSAAFYRIVVSQRALGANQRQRICGSLACVLARLYAISDNSELLEEATSYGAESSRLRADRYSSTGLSPSSLALKLSNRSWKVADTATFQCVIRLKREELSGYSPEHVDRASCCSALAGYLLKYFRETGDESMLDEAIALNREALSLRPFNHPERAEYCGYLSDSLSARYLRTADDSVLQEAKLLAEESLSLRPSGHPEYPHSCTRMASILFSISRLYNDSKLLEESLVLHSRALTFRNIGNPERGRTLSHMGEVYLQKYFWTCDVRNLHDACVAIREEIALRPPGHRYWAHARATYGIVLFEWYKHNGNEDHLRKAIGLCHEAATMTHSRHFALARTSIMYLQPTTSLYNPSMAMSCLEEVLRITPQQTLGIWSSIMDTFDALLTDDVFQKHASNVLRLLRAAIDWLPLLAGFALDRRSQLRVLRRADRVGWQALTVALYTKNHAEGVELLDRARGFMWSQALHVKDPQLKDLPSELGIELDALLRSMSDSSRISDESWSKARANMTQRDLTHYNSDRIQAVLHQIRSLPGLHRFMLGLPYSDLRNVATHHPVVILAATRGGCHAWIIGQNRYDTDDGPSVIDLPIAPHELQSLTYHKQSGSRRGSAVPVQRRMRMRHSPSESEVKLSFIWDRIVKPVVDALKLTPAVGRARPRLVWCPTGDFSFLPLHAAGYYKGANPQCCSDFVVSSYTPTIAALLRAQANSQIPSVSMLKILLVGEAMSSSLDLPPLHNVKTELDLISTIAHRAHVSVESIGEGNADILHVTGKLETAHLVHLACHGIQDLEDALTSGFCLRDGSLTISRLMELKLDTSFLAFLSACETAHGNEAQPDEVVHLAAAMLFAGFRSIVATMWAMNDADGPSIAEIFYTNLLSGSHVSADDVPYALDAAVTKLRNTGLPVERWATFVHMGA